MKCRTILFAVLCVTTLAAQTSAPKEPAKCTVQGQVVQEPGGQPLKKVNIRLAGSGGYATVTDAEGHFKIEDVTPGNYQLWLAKSGFVEAGKHHAEFFYRSLSLDPGQELKDLLIRMQPAAVIVGKIVDDDGDPQVNVRISVFRHTSASKQRFDEQSAESTNDLGEFRIGGLSPGRYIVSASPGFRQALQEGKKEQPKETTLLTTTYYPGTTDKSQAVPLELHAGDEVPVTFSLASARAFNIRGTVRPPSPGAEWVVLESRDRNGIEEASVDQNGSFEIQGVLPGSYTARLVTASIPEDIRTDPKIEVSNTDVDGVHLVPHPTGLVRGQFRMDSGQKIDWSKVGVQLSDDDDSDSAFVARTYSGETTNAQVKNDGSFELKKVPAGTYHLLVTTEDPKLRDYFVKTANLGGRDVGDTGLKVAGGTYSLDVVASPNGVTIQGTVVDAKDHPVADATVVCVPDAKRRKRSDLYQQDTSDQHGHFRLHGLNPGEYTILAFEELDDDYHDPDFIKAHQTQGETVKIEEGGSKSVQVKVIPAAEEQP
jgi:hypothetical protein